MKTLNKKERELAIVSADLLLKGSPEWRIANYAFNQRFTPQQLDHLLEKIGENLTKETKFLIRTNFRDISVKDCSDMSKLQGGALREWLNKGEA